jgi:hypothetical protein
MASRVVLRTFNYRHEAEVVKGYLQARGIESFVISDDCGAVDPALEYGRGTQLLVAEEDLRRAMDALAASDAAAVD